MAFLRNSETEVAPFASDSIVDERSLTSAYLSVRSYDKPKETENTPRKKLTNRVYTYKGPYQSSNIQHEGRVSGCYKLTTPALGFFYLFFVTIQVSPFFRIRD